MPLSEKGSDELATALTKIADGLDDVTPDGDVVVARARRLAPVDTGALSHSIRGTGTGATATIGTSSSYGLPVHFGVPRRNQRAQPFLHQAVEAEQRSIVDEYTKDVAALIEQKV
jgi:hypothetical protein